MLAGVGALLMLLAPLREVLFFLIATAEQKYAYMRMPLNELLDDLVHQSGRVHLALMGGKRRDANPLLKGVFYR